MLILLTIIYQPLWGRVTDSPYPLKPFGVYQPADFAEP
ncbi:hypothetical protein SPLC1_S032420 [Arthrospira platensis C1]|nr:hypothetical protein SPLC1_S032420 [Arthrospira platensis C1]